MLDELTKAIESGIFVDFAKKSGCAKVEAERIEGGRFLFAIADTKKH